MNKSTLKYFWSYFKQLKTESEFLFAHQNGKWAAHNISHDLGERSEGELDEEKLNSIAPTLEGSQLYIVHNHPGGEPTPSDFDLVHYYYIHALLSGYNLNIEDFLIVSSAGYFSFKEAGFLNTSPLYQTKLGKDMQVSIPIASTITLDSTHHQELWNLSQQYTEFIFYKSEEVSNQYASSHDFSPTFLTELINTVRQKHVFYRRRTHCPNELERLRAIDAILNPIEIYWVNENETVPLKIQGII